MRMHDYKAFRWVLEHKAVPNTNVMLAVWHEQWEECISDTFEQAQHLIKPQETSVQNVGSNPVITATFEIRTRPHRPHGFALDVCIVALGSLLAGNYHVPTAVSSAVYSNHMLNSRQQAASSASTRPCHATHIVLLCSMHVCV